MKRKWQYGLVVVVLAMVLSGCQKTAEGEKEVGTSVQQEQVQSQPTLEKETFLFTDSCGREVELPVQMTKVAPSGLVAQMVLYSVAPSSMASWANHLTDEQKELMNPEYTNLPVTGQFYGKGKLNMETLVQVAPQVVIDVGNKKKDMEKDLDALQEKIGIPVIFIEGTLETYPEMFRTLGKLLGQEKQGERLAAYTYQTLEDAKKAREEIADDEVVSVMFGTGKTGLDCNAEGSLHAKVLEIVGAKNAIQVAELSNRGGGNTVTMEEVLKADPETILFEAGGPYEEVKSSAIWGSLSAIKEGKYFEIPYGPYHFLSNPPSINQIIGIKWLGNLLYPEFYAYDMKKEVQDFYKLFWHYNLSEDEATELLARSTDKEK